MSTNPTLSVRIPLPENLKASKADALPKGWRWMRRGEVIHSKDRFRHSDGHVSDAGARLGTSLLDDCPTRGGGLFGTLPRGFIRRTSAVPTAYPSERVIRRAFRKVYGRPLEAVLADVIKNTLDEAQA